MTNEKKSDGPVGHRDLKHQEQGDNVKKATEAGTVAGFINRDGFRQIEIDGQTYRSDHLAWFYMTGAWPDGEIEHIDGDLLNDRWSNLGLKTSAQA